MSQMGVSSGLRFKRRYSWSFSAPSGQNERNASLALLTGGEVRVPNRGRRVIGVSNAVGLATGDEAFSITTVSPACTSCNSRRSVIYMECSVAM